MPVPFSIYKLFFVVGDMLRDEGRVFVPDDGSEHNERLELFFDTLQRNAHKPETYFRIVDTILEHESPDIVYRFLHHILRSLDETTTLENVFEAKDDLSDAQLLVYSNCCRDVRKFKQYITSCQN
jgi:hypothetical protein